MFMRFQQLRLAHTAAHMFHHIGITRAKDFVQPAQADFWCRIHQFSP